MQFDRKTKSTCRVFTLKKLETEMNMCNIYLTDRNLVKMPGCLKSDSNMSFHSFVYCVRVRCVLHWLQTIKNDFQCIKPLQFEMGSAKPASYQEGTQPMASLSCHVQIGLCIFLDGNGSRRQAARSKATAAKSLNISHAVSYLYQNNAQLHIWAGIEF